MKLSSTMAVGCSLTLGAVTWYLLSPGALAQQPRQQQRQQRPADERGEQFAEQFWDWLVKSRYKQWGPWPGQDGDFYPGQEPHGAKLKLYVNRATASKPQDPAEGAVIVKENYTPEEELAAITVMYRPQREYNPEHGNWYWIKYDPDGTVDTMNGNRLAGRVEGCIKCHSTAQGEDYIFENDDK